MTRGVFTQLRSATMPPSRKRERQNVTCRRSRPDLSEMSVFCTPWPPDGQQHDSRSVLNAEA